MATRLLLDPDRQDPRIPHRAHTDARALTKGNCAGVYHQGIDLMKTVDARAWVGAGYCETCPVQELCEAQIAPHLENGGMSRRDPLLGLWGGRFFRLQNGNPVEVNLLAPTRKSSNNWSRKVSG